MTNADNSATQSEIAPVWCIAANVREEIPYGVGATETRRGTVKFHGGAKVYLAGGYWGMGMEQAIVVGRFRGKGFIVTALKTRFLTNFKAELVYSPAIITRLLANPDYYFKWDGSQEAKARAEDYAKKFSTYSDEQHNKQLAKRGPSESQSPHAPDQNLT